MAQKVYTVEGRQFRTEGEYARAKHDKAIIDKIRTQTDLKNKKELEKLRTLLEEGKYRFLTPLGQDFKEEVEELLAAAKKNAAMNAKVEEELRRGEKRRKIITILCSMVGVGCLAYFGFYSYLHDRTQNYYQELSQLKDKEVIVDSGTAPPAAEAADPLFTPDGETKYESREVLDEFKNLLIKNKKVIGWIKIDDTNIDYPVMQTTDNEYYLNHDIDQNVDNNGTIFMDKDCDVLNPSTNYILYGHHMKSGMMFGNLDKYQRESYYKEHPYISFDTIYEKGTYQVMYVFRSRVYKETEIVFKYYQFIDASSAKEFDSYMQEMAAISLYDTGVTAEYGDHLLTLSTCDYQETDGRFVVVAKKIAEE